jgi:hypothetical protein
LGIIEGSPEMVVFRFGAYSRISRTCFYFGLEIIQGYLEIIQGSPKHHSKTFKTSFKDLRNFFQRLSKLLSMIYGGFCVSVWRWLRCGFRTVPGPPRDPRIADSGQFTDFLRSFDDLPDIIQ